MKMKEGPILVGKRRDAVVVVSAARVGTAPVPRKLLSPFLGTDSSSSTRQVRQWSTTCYDYEENRHGTVFNFCKKF